MSLVSAAQEMLLLEGAACLPRLAAVGGGIPVGGSAGFVQRGEGERLVFVVVAVPVTGQVWGGR